MTDNAETATSSDAQEAEPSAPAEGTETETAANPDVEKWKALSRQNEKAAKEARQELEALRKQHETDIERQIREAREAARTETLTQVAGDRVADAIRVAAAQRAVNVDALIEGVDPAKFITDGQPDIAKVNAWVERIAPAGKGSSEFPDVQGSRNPTPALNSDSLLEDLKRAVGAS